MLAAYDPVAESAHRLGRVLHAIGDETCTAAVLKDVVAEIEAIERAKLGDLSRRAAQAVEPSRTTASPPQVTATDPLGGIELFTAVHPTSAAVATARRR